MLWHVIEWLIFERTVVSIVSVLCCVVNIEWNAFSATLLIGNWEVIKIASPPSQASPLITVRWPFSSAWSLNFIFFLKIKKLSTSNTVFVILSLSRCFNKTLFSLMCSSIRFVATYHRISSLVFIWIMGSHTVLIQEEVESWFFIRIELTHQAQSWNIPFKAKLEPDLVTASGGLFNVGSLLMQVAC